MLHAGDTSSGFVNCNLSYSWYVYVVVAMLQLLRSRLQAVRVGPDHLFAHGFLPLGVGTQLAYFLWRLP
jgi:hypothetical protein